MKLKQRRHLEASLQSTENPESKPAIDCMAAPCGLCQGPGSSPIQAPPDSCWHTRDGHHGAWVCKFSWDWLQRPGSHKAHGGRKAQRPRAGWGWGCCRCALTLLAVFFGKGVPYALFSKGLMTCSDPLLTLHHSQGGRTRFCFLSLFNS